MSDIIKEDVLKQENQDAALVLVDQDRERDGKEQTGKKLDTESKEVIEPSKSFNKKKAKEPNIPEQKASKTVPQTNSKNQLKTDNKEPIAVDSVEHVPDEDSSINETFDVEPNEKSVQKDWKEHEEIENKGVQVPSTSKARPVRPSEHLYYSYDDLSDIYENFERDVVDTDKSLSSPESDD